MDRALRPRILQKGLRPFILAAILYIPTFIFILNQTDTEIDGQANIDVGDYHCRLRLPVRSKAGFWAALRSFRILRIPLDGIGSKLNTKIRCSFVFEDRLVKRYLTFRRKRLHSNTKLYYLPFSIRRNYRSGRCVHLRCSRKAALTIVRRPLDVLEQGIRFRFLESWLFSALLYLAGRTAARFSSTNVAVFYEKYAVQSDEGVFDIFQAARQTTSSDCYFVSDFASDFVSGTGQAPDSSTGVLRKHSLRYYWLIYRATVFIGAEAPGHLTLLRSNNRWLRRCLYTRPFVFLQHGIIYMKNLSKNSSFVSGREAAADYIVASSKKERDIIVRDLRYAPEQVLVCGIAQFAVIPYKHITSSSPDIVTVMLTWKPSQEHLDYRASANYQSLQQILSVLGRLIPRENIRLVPHPREVIPPEAALSVPVWQASVRQALSETKLLITDYSSICYNAFYRGAGVIFYQPDLDEYQRESGRLIPADDEFIGPRLFSITGLKRELDRVIDSSGHIALDKVRSEQHEAVYATINEFTDGKNIQRIVAAIHKLGLL